MTPGSRAIVVVPRGWHACAYACARALPYIRVYRRIYAFGYVSTHVTANDAKSTRSDQSEDAAYNILAYRLALLL